MEACQRYCFEETEVLRWRLEMYREEHFLMEVGIEFHVAGEL